MVTSRGAQHASTRSDRAVARRDRRPHDASCAPRRQGSGRTCAARPRVVGARLHSGRAVHRRRVFTAQEDDVRRRHAGPPERRGRVFGLSRRSRACRSRSRRRGEAARRRSRARLPTSGSTARSIPRSSSVLLEPSPAAVVRGGVRRPLRRRAHARAAGSASPICRSPGSADRTFRPPAAS